MTEKFAWKSQKTKAKLSIKELIFDILIGLLLTIILISTFGIFGLAISYLLFKDWRKHKVVEE